MLKPPILCKKKQDKTSLDRDSLLGRICNPTAISMSICNAENGKRKRIINPYTKCCRITNTAERDKKSRRRCIPLSETPSATCSCFLLDRICNPTAISMSICNAENGKAKADYKSLY